MSQDIIGLMIKEDSIFSIFRLVCYLLTVSVLFHVGPYSIYGLLIINITVTCYLVVNDVYIHLLYTKIVRVWFDIKYLKI